MADNFMPTFKVQGYVYHLVGSLLQETGQNAKCLQIYFVGEDERETDIRCKMYLDLKPSLIKQLQKMLHDVNPYIQDLKNLIDKLPSTCKYFKVVIYAEKNLEKIIEVVSILRPRMKWLW